MDDQIVIWRGARYLVCGAGERFGEPWLLIRAQIGYGLFSGLTRWAPARLCRTIGG
jgi:hypothetical protein